MGRFSQLHACLAAFLVAFFVAFFDNIVIALIIFIP